MSEQPGSAKVLAVRHFKDINDLLNYGLDAPLEPGQEKTAEKIAHSIVEEVSRSGKEAVFIISSPANRARETAELLRRAISKIKPDLKVRITTNEQTREIDQGEIVLPFGYQAGEEFAPLGEAWETFWKETFPANDIFSGNLGYKFGAQSSANAGNRFHEAFEKTGESYFQLAHRVLEAMSDYAKIVDDKRAKNLQIVLVTHSATLSIIREVMEVVSKIIDNSIQNYQAGQLIPYTWLSYQDRRNKDPQRTPHGEYRAIDPTGLMPSTKAREILDTEIAYINNEIQNPQT